MKRILVGVDGSEHEREVIRVGVTLAVSLGAELYLVRAVGLPTHRLQFGLLSLSPDEIEQAMLDIARKDVEVLLLTVPEALRGGVRAEIGTPVQVVEDVARELDVDLIIIGSHGHGAIDRLLGSTAAKIVNHAERSVLVVRAPKRLAPDA